MYLSIERRMLLGFGLVVFLVLSITGVSFQVSKCQRDLNRAVEQNYQVQTQSEDVLSLVARARAKDVDFLLTGDAHLIARHADDLAEIESGIASLQRLTANYSVQQWNVRQLHKHILANMKIDAEVIALRRKGQTEAARKIVFSSQAKTAKENLEACAERMEQEESHLLELHSLAVETYRQNTDKLFNCLHLFMLLALSIVYFGVRATHKRTVSTLESIFDGFFVLDANWNFTYVNRQAETLLKKSRAELLGKNIWKLFPGAEETLFGQNYHRAAQEQTTQRFEAFYPPLSHWVEVVVYPSDKGLSVCFHDITQQKAVNERFRVLFEQSSNAHLLFDDTGIVDCNNAAVQMLGCEDKRAVLALHPAVLSPEFQPDGRRSEEKCIEMDGIARTNGYHRFEWMHRKSDGTIFPVEVTLTPVLLNGKDTLLVVWHDLTERKQMENALRASESRLRDMVDNLPAGAIFVDGERILLNRAVEELTGYSREELPTVATWFHTLYRDNADTIRAFYEQGRKAGFPDSPIFPILRKDGAIRQVQFAAYSYANGEVWLLNDLTERLVAERENARLATILEASPDFVGTATQEGFVIYQNSALNDLLGVSQEEVSATNPHISRFMPPWALKQIKHEILPVITQQGYCQCETALLRPDGTEVPVLMTMIGHKEIDSDVRYMSVIFRDITSRKQEEEFLAKANEHLEQQIKLVNEQTAELEAQQAELEAANRRLTALATKDGLTGLYNHRAFQEKLNEEFERTQRYKTPLSIILLDVDKFKTYNDAFGHPQGDEVLKTVAQILQDVARNTDYVCRYGGEEFVMVLPNTDLEGASNAAERFRAAIQQHPWALRPVTASFGISTLHAGVTTAQELVSQADKALYASKKQGRNQCTHFANLSLLEELGELVGNTSLPYSDILREMLHEQKDTLASASEQMREMLANAYDATILSWSRILDMKDKETQGHSERVTEMMVSLARSIGMNSEEVMYARWGALLHDIGKMSVPDDILHKTEPLSEAEWVIMRHHTTVAYEMLSPISFLRPALDIPHYHHEKWDGTGYPRGLKGEEIPLSARLFAVIDVYDALTTDRPYRAAWSTQQTLAHLTSLSGTHFDPRAVRAFLAMLQQKETSQIEVPQLFAA